MGPRKWNVENLVDATTRSFSIRQTLKLLGLQPAGGNYDQLKKYIDKYKIDTSHFRGKGWSKGMHGIGKPRLELSNILRVNSTYQSFKLKKRLFSESIKLPKCELCGWAKIAADGRMPLELDHINGNRHDNRLSNLRILCPNCHSLQPTHRGKNINRYRAWVAEWHTRDT